MAPVRNEVALHKGFTVFLNGLSGAGKSTIANVLLVKLVRHGRRRVTVLDGDVLRKSISCDLDFSREHRDINMRRIGLIAMEIHESAESRYVLWRTPACSRRVSAHASPQSTQYSLLKA